VAGVRLVRQEAGAKDGCANRIRFPSSAFFSSRRCPRAFALRCLGVVGEAGKWVTRSGVVEIFCVRLQELMELL
jgi:hypothetical protein